ncbi:MAG: OmpH family outer membrane protein [Chitinophagaceae bacterium]|nr:OmpH family outer membrane protein [Chitinophagaceae bacterium]
MKRIFPGLAFICFFIIAGNDLLAQTKIGHISIQDLVSAMPEFKKASTDLEELEKALIAQGDEYQTEYARQDSIYRTDSINWNSATKEVKRRELNTISLKVINFNQDAQQKLARREQELVAPIQEKALQTTRLVAKENGYSYILNKEQLLVSPTSDDVLPLVLKKLGITVPAPESKK